MSNKTVAIVLAACAALFLLTFAFAAMVITRITSEPIAMRPTPPIRKPEKVEPRMNTDQTRMEAAEPAPPTAEDLAAAREAMAQVEEVRAWIGKYPDTGDGAFAREYWDQRQPAAEAARQAIGHRELRLLVGALNGPLNAIVFTEVSRRPDKTQKLYEAHRIFEEELARVEAFIAEHEPPPAEE